MGITMSSWIVYDYECICISMYSFHSFVIRIRRITASIYPFMILCAHSFTPKAKSKIERWLLYRKHCNSSDLSIILIDLPTVLSFCIFSIIHVDSSFSLHTCSHILIHHLNQYLRCHCRSAIPSFWLLLSLQCTIVLHYPNYSSLLVIPQYASSNNKHTQYITFTFHSYTRIPAPFWFSHS